MAWSHDPAAPTPIAGPGWSSSPAAPTRPVGLSFYNPFPARTAKLNGAGTLAATVKQRAEIAVTLTGEGQVAATTSQKYSTAAPFSNADSSNTGVAINGLSAWWYTYASHPVDFSGSGQLYGNTGEDGLTAIVGGERYSTADTQGSVGTFAVSMYQKYSIAAAFSGGSLLGFLVIGGDDGLTATTKPSLPGTESSVGTLAAAIYQKYAVALGLSGSGTLSAAARMYLLNIASALSGGGSLSSTQFASYARAVGLSGAGGLSSTQIAQYLRSAALSGSGTLSAAARMYLAYAERANATSDIGWETGGNSTAYARTGTKSMIVTGNGVNYILGAANMQNQVDCTPGQQVYVETWVYGDPTNTQTTDTLVSWGVGCWAQFDDTTGANTTTWQGDSRQISAALHGVWTKLSFTLTVPAGYNRLQVWFGVGPTVNNGEKYYFDDPIIRPLNFFQGGGTFGGTMLRQYLRSAALSGGGTLAGPLIPAISSGNTAYDPNFETDGNSTDYARSGTKSVKMIGDHTNYQAWPIGPWGWSTYPCNPGQQIYIEVWVLGKPTNAQTLTDGVGVTVSFTDSSGVNGQIWPGQSMTISTALNGVWTKVCYTATVPAGYDGYVSYCWVSNSANVGETFYFDDPVSRPLNQLGSIGYLTAIAAKLENRSAALSGGGTLSATLTAKLNPVFTAASTCPTTTNNTTTGSWSHAGGSYSNMSALMVVQGLGANFSGALAATYGGTSMTLSQFQKGNNTDNQETLAIFRLDGIASGTQTAVITCSVGTNIHKAHVITYANVQSLSIGAINFSSGTSMSVASAAAGTADMLFAAFVSGTNSGSSAITGFSGTQRVNYVSDNSILNRNQMACGDFVGTGSTITATATGPQSNPWSAATMIISGKTV